MNTGESTESLDEKIRAIKDSVDYKRLVTSHRGYIEERRLRELNQRITAFENQKKMLLPPTDTNKKSFAISTGPQVVPRTNKNPMNSTVAQGSFPASKIPQMRMRNFGTAPPGSLQREQAPVVKEMLDTKFYAEPEPELSYEPPTRISLPAGARRGMPAPPVKVEEKKVKKGGLYTSLSRKGTPSSAGSMKAASTSREGFKPAMSKPATLLTNTQPQKNVENMNDDFDNTDTIYDDLGSGIEVDDNVEFNSLGDDDLDVFG